MTLHIDLQQAPPTAEQLESECAAARAAEEAGVRRTIVCGVLSFLLGFVCFGCLLMVALRQQADTAAALTFVAFLASLFGCVAAGVLAMDSIDRTSDLYEPMSDAASERLIKACLRDEVVDTYRQRVVSQGRALTSLEFRAIVAWDQGHELRKLAELAKQNRPLRSSRKRLALQRNSPPLREARMPEVNIDLETPPRHRHAACH